MSEEQFDIMAYDLPDGDGDGDFVELRSLKTSGDVAVQLKGSSMQSLGLMTKTEAEQFARENLPVGSRLTGWKAGTCQSVFQFWVPAENTAVEIPHGDKPPEGREAAIEWTREKHGRAQED